MTLYFYNYNNYKNRILKREEELSDYGTPLLSFSTNFNPEDNITATAIVNTPLAQQSLGNYCLAVGSYDTIESRWFVTEQIYIRNGQYKVLLMRDVLADFYDDVISATSFIKKGYLPQSSPAFYLDEGYKVNQIKKREVLLKDTSGCAWIVGYLNNNPETEYPVIDIGAQVPADLSVDSISSWPLSQYIGAENAIESAKENEIDMRLTIQEGSSRNKLVYEFTQERITNSYQENNISDLRYRTNHAEYILTNFPLMFLLLDKSELVDAILAVEGLDGYPTTTIDNMHALNNKVVKDTSTNKYYRITYVEETRDIDPQFRVDSSVLAKTDELVSSFNVLADGMAIDTYPDYYGGISYTLTAYTNYITLTEVSAISGASSLTISTERRHLADAPYDMFCIPYTNDKTFTYEDNGTKTIQLSKDYSAYIAAAMTRDLGAALYDIQLLPYCPIPSVRAVSGNYSQQDFASLELAKNVDWQAIENLGVIFWCQTSKDTFDIRYTHKQTTSNNIVYKARAITRFIRLCSPNYSSVFEINPFENGGITRINVDFVYRPYQPYIHLNPDFGFLYGKDWDDARGLICSGDFSLTQINEAFTNYQLNNKNFTEIFERQLDNLKVKQDVGRFSDVFGAATGAFTMAVQGAAVGSTFGPVGTAIGAAAGGVVSTAGGIADYGINEMLRAEELSYTKDMHELSLGNIRAIPNTITKLTAMNPNNKIFPYIEEYQTTSEEETAISTMLRYNGMTVNKISTIGESLANLSSGRGFFAADPIEFIGKAANEDTHLVDVLSGEMSRGFYIIKE